MKSRDEYDAIDALNWSTLKNMGESARYLKHLIDHPEENQDKDSYRLGRAIHRRILEDDFDSHYVIMQNFGDMRSSTNRATRDDWLNEQVDLGYEIITDAEYQAAVRASDAIMAHPEAMRLLEGTEREKTVTWDADGIKCKGRLDIIGAGVTDLKMTRHRTIRQILNDAANYDYHAQVAWYHDGAVKAGLIDGKVLPMAIFVHVSLKSEFTDVIILDMNQAPETFLEGKSHYSGLLDFYRGCMSMDHWPGVATRPIPWTLPRWKTMIEEGE